MRKAIRQMVDRKYSGLKFRHAGEMMDAHRLWHWEDDGLIAYSTASVGELGKIAEMNGLRDGEYALITRES